MEVLLSNSSLADKVLELERKVEFLLNFLKIPSTTDFKKSSLSKTEQDPPKLPTEDTKEKWVGGGKGDFQCQVCGVCYLTKLKLDYHKMKLKHRQRDQRKSKGILLETTTQTGDLDNQKNNHVAEDQQANDDLDDDTHSTSPPPTPPSPLEADNLQDNSNDDDHQSGSEQNNKPVDSPNTSNGKSGASTGLGLRTRKRKQPEVEKGSAYFPCPICGVRFPTQAKLNSHKTKEKHTLYRRINGAPKITCEITEICGHQASGQVSFRRHYSKHTTDKPFLCSLCGKAVKSEPTLKSHMRLVHQTEGKNWQCNICQSWHRSEQSLKTHYLIHEGKMDQMCPHCGKIYAQLKRHIVEVHDKVRAFECHLCPHKFKKKSHLERHLGSHAKGDKRRVKGYHVERPEVYARRKCEKKVVRLVGINGESSEVGSIGNDNDPRVTLESSIEGGKGDGEIDGGGVEEMNN